MIVFELDIELKLSLANEQIELELELEHYNFIVKLSLNIYYLTKLGLSTTQVLVDKICAMITSI